MKLLISKASDSLGKSCPCKCAIFSERNWYIEIETLEDLIKIYKEVNASLIFSAETGETPSIEIYDDYVD